MNIPREMNHKTTIRGTRDFGELKVYTKLVWENISFFVCEPK